MQLNINSAKPKKGCNRKIILHQLQHQYKVQYQCYLSQPNKILHTFFQHYVLRQELLHLPIIIKNRIKWY